VYPARENNAKKMVASRLETFYGRSLFFEGFDAWIDDPKPIEKPRPIPAPMKVSQTSIPFIIPPD